MVGRLLALFTVVAATQAAAQPGFAPTGGRASLVWRAPAGCPDAASVQSRVEQRLERSLDDVQVGIEIEVTRAAGRYIAEIDLRAVTVANDVRTLTSKRCSELADAVAVIVARVASEMISTRAAARPPTPAVAVAAADDEPPMVVARALRPTTFASRPPAPTWALGARVSGLSGIGLLPKIGLGGEFAITFRRHGYLAELAGTRWFASAAQFHDGAPSKVEVDLDVAAARFGWRTYELPLRAWTSVELGYMRGAGVRLPTEQLESGRWIAAGAGFGVAWQMNRWARLVGGIETMLAIDRVRFTLGDGIVVYAPSPMSVRTSCGLEIGWQ